MTGALYCRACGEQVASLAGAGLRWHVANAHDGLAWVWDYEQLRDRFTATPPPTVVRYDAEGGRK